VIDTLALARELFPGKRNNLDALCDRLAVNNSHRSYHGAMLDAQLLVDVYLAMTRGQETLTIDIGAPALYGVEIGLLGAGGAAGATARATLRVIAPSPEELDLHHRYLDVLQKESKGRCVWLAIAAAATPSHPGT